MSRDGKAMDEKKGPTGTLAPSQRWSVARKVVIGCSATSRPIRSRASWASRRSPESLKGMWASDEAQVETVPEDRVLVSRNRGAVHDPLQRDALQRHRGRRAWLRGALAL